MNIFKFDSTGFDAHDHAAGIDLECCKCGESLPFGAHADPVLIERALLAHKCAKIH